MNSPSSPYPVLLTSLAEIWSFNPCNDGWDTILGGQKKLEADRVLFPILEAVESNGISDVCWLLKKRKTEIQVAVKFARLCADSVKHLDNSYSRAAYADAYAGVNTYAGAVAVAAADAADAAADAAYDADDADAADAATQKEKNKQFMILCLSHFNPVTNQVELPS